MSVEDWGFAQGLQRENKRAVGMLCAISLSQASQALTVKNLTRIIDGVNALDRDANATFGNRFLDNRNMSFIK